MRTGAALGLAALALGGLAGCGNGDDTSVPEDGGSAETVSKADFVTAAAEACTRATERIDELEAPQSNLASTDLTPAELEEAAQRTEQLVAIHDELVSDLDDMPQPADSTDAQDANQIVDDLGTALENLRRVVQAAESGDASAVQATWAEYVAAHQTYAQAARSFGLEECGGTA